MNILANLIPGAREIRTPLLIGYLWIAVAWINYPRLPQNVRTNEMIARAHDGVTHLNLATILVVLSIGAFFIGLILELAGKFARAACVGALMVAVIFKMFFVVAGIILTRPQVTLPAMTAISLVLFYINRRHKKLARFLGQQGLNIALSAPELAVMFEVMILPVIMPARQKEREFIAMRIDRSADTEFLDNFCRKLDRHSLRWALIGMPSPPKLHTETPMDVKTIGKARRAYWRDESSAETLRSYLRECMKVSTKIRAHVYLRAMEISDIKERARKAFTTCIMLIRKDNPETYAHYERLQSEADLRTETAIPIGALVASVIYALALKEYFLYIALACTIALLFAGARKREEAAELIYTCIENDRNLAGVHADVMDEGLAITWRHANDATPAPGRLASKARHLLMPHKRPQIPESTKPSAEPDTSI